LETSLPVKLSADFVPLTFSKPITASVQGLPPMTGDTRVVADRVVNGLAAHAVRVLLVAVQGVRPTVQQDRVRELVADEFVTNGRERALLWAIGSPVGSEPQKIRP
jgi:hypothetical protein